MVSKKNPAMINSYEINQLSNHETDKHVFT